MVISWGMIWGALAKNGLTKSSAIWLYSQSEITRSKLAVEKLEQGVKYAER